MLLMPERWDQRDDLLTTLKSTIATAPERGLYYPGAEQRIGDFVAQYPNADDLSGKGRYIVDVPRSTDLQYAEESEVFAPVLGVIDVEGADTETYLRNAVAYCNDSLHGTLGANIIIARERRVQLDNALATAAIDDQTYQQEVATLERDLARGTADK